MKTEQRDTQNLDKKAEEGSYNRLDCVLTEIGLPKDGDYPLVDKFVSLTAPYLKIRSHVVDIAQTKGPEGLLSLGVPPELSGIVAMWATEGPAIITSYCHPEKLNLYKMTGLLNLALYLRALSDQGIAAPMGEVLEGWYDTIPLQSTAVRPFALGEIFPVPYSFIPAHVTHGLQRLPEFAITEAVTVDRAMATADALYDRLHTSVTKLRQSARLAGEIQKRGALPAASCRDGIRTVLRGRMIEVLGYVDAASQDLSLGRSLRNPTAAQLLMPVCNNVGLGILMPNGGHNVSSLEQAMGISWGLISEQYGYRRLVMDTLKMLGAACGPNVIRDCVEPWEELFIGKDGEEVTAMTKDDTGNIIILNKRTLEAIITIAPGDELKAAESLEMTPLSSMELLALVAGGTTLHMGAEQNGRERVLALLGVSGQYADYLRGLRIGQDGEHGNPVFDLQGQKKPVSLLLMYVLFGKEYVRRCLLGVAGRTNVPIIFTANELKEKAAETLVAEALGVRMSDPALAWDM